MVGVRRQGCERARCFVSKGTEMNVKRCRVERCLGPVSDLIPFCYLIYRSATLDIQKDR